MACAFGEASVREEDGLTKRILTGNGPSYGWLAEGSDWDMPSACLDSDTEAG